MSTTFELSADLKKAANPEQAKNLARFFKTGPGQYGEGDRFLGIKMPVLRTLARKRSDTDFDTLKELLAQPIHEHRMIALLILTYRYAHESEAGKQNVYEFYVENRQGINNWDLVDVTTPRIVGDFMLHHPEKRTLLYDFARTGSLWERRIAIIATFSLLRAGQYADTLAIADLLLHYPHDLIHKAVGWMLREVGKRDLLTETEFLDSRYQTMPRTMLRYAIERFDEPLRQHYLAQPASARAARPR